jgi:hypothetical protein
VHKSNLELRALNLLALESLCKPLSLLLAVRVEVGVSCLILNIATRVENDKAGRTIAYSVIRLACDVGKCDI